MSIAHRTVSSPTRPSRPLVDADEIQMAMAEIEKGQQLAGHFPDAEALERAERVLTGAMSAEDAMDEVRRKYQQA